MLRTFVSAIAVALVVCQLPLSAQQPAPTKPHVHNHAEHGPHGGELLEVGKEEYHVELMIDEAKKQIVVYLLDGQVKSFVALDVPFIAMNLKMSGKPVQMKLKQIPQEIDKQGFSSRYGIASPELLDALHGGHADARLALKIGNKAYSVKVEHDHNHAGHPHGPEMIK